MNKKELVEALAVHFGGNKAEATRALNAVLQTIIYKTTTEATVTILGFGTFEKTVRPGRVVYDPHTKERHRVKALATPRFRPGSEFKAYVSGAKRIPKPPRKKATAKTRADQPRPTSRSDHQRKVPLPRPNELDSAAGSDRWTNNEQLRSPKSRRPQSGVDVRLV